MPEDIRSMQQDAIRRAREMYRRAMPSPQPETAAPSVSESQESSPTAPQQPSPMFGQSELEDFAKSFPPASEINPSDGELTPDFIETFFKDNEKMMIVALLVILSGEDCDNSLLFALMFLLL